MEAEAYAANAEFNELQAKLSSTPEPEKTRLQERMKKLDDIRHDCMRKIRMKKGTSAR